MKKLLILATLLVANSVYAESCATRDLMGLGMPGPLAAALGCDGLTGNTSITGTLTTSAGITATTGNIAATAGALSAGTTVTGGTGLTATTGNITSTAGNVVISTTDKGVVSGSDATTVKVCGGSDDATANGAFITLDGDDVGSSDAGAGVVVNVGNNTAAKLSIVHNATEVAAVNSSGLTVTGAIRQPASVMETVAAAGANQGNSAALAAGKFIHMVTAADETTGVVLPACAAANVGEVHFIMNTVANKFLNIWPASSGNINGLGANAVYAGGATGQGRKTHVCACQAANVWYCG